MTKKSFRNICISIFVIVWTLVFHYESTRAFYLYPFFNHSLPKVKFLFPPAGWIMFFNVDNSYGCAEVYGVKDGKLQLIDPHDILQTRFIGFDNIKRNVLVSVLNPSMRNQFCRFMKRKFPEFDNFIVTSVHYPSVSGRSHERLQSVIYRCN